jgi:hypothetical protein
MEKTRKDEDSHLQARRDDGGVEEDQRWTPEIKNKEEQNASSKNNNGAFLFQMTQAEEMRGSRGL